MQCSYAIRACFWPALTLALASIQIATGTLTPVNAEPSPDMHLDRHWNLIPVNR